MSEMIEPAVFLDFFRDILQKHLEESGVEESECTTATQAMNRAYRPKVMTAFESRELVDYNRGDNKCAYLHKYAALHAATVQFAILKYRDAVKNIRTLRYKSTVDICCLGGGPGTDIVGVSAALCSMQLSPRKRCRFTTVDSRHGWFSAHRDIFKVADPTRHGKLGEFLYSRASGIFVHDDMLSPKKETMHVINSADLVTIVKFVSAVDPGCASGMLQNVFSRMKPGALVLFVDNSGGGSYETTEHAATECALEEVGIPFRKIKYGNPVFSQERFGVCSRHYVSVAIKMWKKPENFFDLSTTKN